MKHLGASQTLKRKIKKKEKKERLKNKHSSVGKCQINSRLQMGTFNVAVKAPKQPS